MLHRPLPTSTIAAALALAISAPSAAAHGTGWPAHDASGFLCGRDAAGITSVAHVEYAYPLPRYLPINPVGGGVYTQPMAPQWMWFRQWAGYRRADGTMGWRAGAWARSTTGLHSEWWTWRDGRWQNFRSYANWAGSYIGDQSLVRGLPARSRYRHTFEYVWNVYDAGGRLTETRTHRHDVGWWTGC